MAGDFTLILNGGIYSNAVFSSGDTPTVFANTEYTLSEVAKDGYIQGTITCEDDGDQSVVGHPVTLNEGQQVTCTITNDDDLVDVIFEGIPTLNQYGLALLALLMLGIGVIGFRRFS